MFLICFDDVYRELRGGEDGDWDGDGSGLGSWVV